MVQEEDFRRYRDNAVYDESRHKFKKSPLTAKLKTARHIAQGTGGRDRSCRSCKSCRSCRSLTMRL